MGLPIEETSKREMYGSRRSLWRLRGPVIRESLVSASQVSAETRSSFSSNHTTYEYAALSPRQVLKTFNMDAH